jgi:hypothetical protein
MAIVNYCAVAQRGSLCVGCAKVSDRLRGIACPGSTPPESTVEVLNESRLFDTIRVFDAARRWGRLVRRASREQRLVDPPGLVEARHGCD